VKNKPLSLLIFGTAGAAKDIYYWIKAINESAPSPQFHVEGFVEADKARIGETVFADEKIVASDDMASDYIMKFDEIGIVVPFGDPELRERCVKSVSGYDNVVFPNIIHPSVVYDPDAGIMGCGNHIGPGAIITSLFSIGDFNFLQAGIVIDHDIKIGNYNSINPKAAVAGNVVIHDRCVLGLNCTVLQGLEIMDDTIVGAGAVLLRNTKQGETLVGNPAKAL
jgi:sugar O-acyltransferase (sialic acid O-acetyltransferase NeuD family)